MAGFIGRRLCLPRQFSSVNKLFCKTILEKQSKSSINFNLIRRESTYEGDGKTVGYIINKKTSTILCVSVISANGFILGNGEEVVGPIILFPHSILGWNVRTVKDVTEESLTLFKVMEPKVDILILGYGKRGDYTPEIRQKFTQICKKLGIPFEALPTEQACGLFNFLADELRLVAGAFIPPSEIDVFKLNRKKELSIEELIEEDEELEERLALEGEEPDKKFLK